MGLQERFLKSMCVSGTPATFYLVNGFQLKGVARAFDEETIFIESSGVAQMVFKHAISTIMPHRRVDVEMYDD